MVVVTQLRDMLAAEQSAEVAQEDQDHRSVGPVVAEPMLLLVRARQLDSSQTLQIHEPQTLALPGPGAEEGAAASR